MQAAAARCENKLPALCHPPVGSLLHSTNTISGDTQPNPLPFTAPFRWWLPRKKAQNHFSFGLRNRFAAINHIDINRGALRATTDTNVTGFSAIVHRVGIEIIQHAHQQHGLCYAAFGLEVDIGMHHFSAGRQTVGGNHHIHKRRDIDRFQPVALSTSFRL